jgi:hypothetical protein
MKNKKHISFLCITFLLLGYIVTWGFWGDKKLAERPFKYQWIQHEIYVNDESFFDDEFPFPTEVLFVSDYYKYPSIIDHNGITRDVIMNFDEPTTREILLETEISFLLIHSHRKWSNPFLQFHEFGFWGFGSDHLDLDTEILVWGFIGWMRIISLREFYEKIYS